MSQQSFLDALQQLSQQMELMLNRIEDRQRRQPKGGKTPKVEPSYSGSISKHHSKWEAPSRQNDKLNFRPKEEKGVSKSQEELIRLWRVRTFGGIDTKKRQSEERRAAKEKSEKKKSEERRDEKKRESEKEESEKEVEKIFESNRPMNLFEANLSHNDFVISKPLGVHSVLQEVDDDLPKEVSKGLPPMKESDSRTNPFEGGEDDTSSYHEIIDHEATKIMHVTTCAKLPGSDSAPFLIEARSNERRCQWSVDGALMELGLINEDIPQLWQPKAHQWPTFQPLISRPLKPPLFNIPTCPKNSHLALRHLEARIKVVLTWPDLRCPNLALIHLDNLHLSCPNTFSYPSQPHFLFLPKNSPHPNSSPHLKIAGQIHSFTPPYIHLANHATSLT